MAKSRAVKKLLTAPSAPAPAPIPGGLSTGVTLLNLACSGHASWGLSRGHLYLFCGDSESGKTMIALTALAEAARHPAFGNYRLIYDKPEYGALMDIEDFFGRTLAERLEAPKHDPAHGPLMSSTVEDFLFNLDDAFDGGAPFVYVLDSFDSLDAATEQEAFRANKKLHRAGKELKGSYGMAKAKLMSNGLRLVAHRLEESRSIIILIAQTRDNIDPMAREKRTRAGGRALKFYSTVEIWTKIVGKLSRTYKDKERDLGIKILVEVRKNRQNGRHPKVVIPFYHSYGLDDLGASIDYLLDEGIWKKQGALISAPELDWKGSRDKLVERIEAQGQEKQLCQLVASTWEDIEDACRLRRQKRYI